MNKVSRIDELVNRQEELALKRQKLQDSMHERNSKRGTAIKKIENKSFRDKVKTEKAVAAIDREMSKNKKLIKLEQEYVCGLSDCKGNIKASEIKGI